MSTSVYRAPVADWNFILTEFLRVQERDDLPGFDVLTRENVKDLIDEAARFHEGVLGPIGPAGDQQGARLENGRVITPDGFPEAWHRYRESGWPFVSVPEDLGGGGLPPLVGSIVSELRMSTAHSFAMYGAFCAAAATMIAALGEPWMREHLALRVASGEWTATMCMTESHAGSDLKQIRTRAVEQPDGSWRIHGEKIFISGGDHDLTDNILHVVLAKLPDEDGIFRADLRSIGVFLVPKLAVDPETGSVGGPNAVEVRSIEHKMGIEGSATCTMAFEGSVGWRVSDGAAEGLARTMGPMFFLMNKARGSTAVSGVAYAELAYQTAAAYARERLAGRAPDGPRQPELAADPIIVHPDIRRLLLGARAFAEGGRALALRVSLLQSEAEALGDRSARKIVELLTPMMKAYFTDRGFTSASDCLQVLGGHGYIRDFGLEQIVRNARIGQIYEGANGIHARDFMRLATGRSGESVAAFFAAVRQSLDAAGRNTAAPDEPGRGGDSPQGEVAADLIKPLAEALDALEQTTEYARTLGDADRAAVAYDLLNAYGTVALAWTWVDLVRAAQRSGDPRLIQTKRALASIWLERELPLAHASCARVRAGGGSLVSLPDDLV